MIMSTVSSIRMFTKLYNKQNNSHVKFTNAQTDLNPNKITHETREKKKQHLNMNIEQLGYLNSVWIIYKFKIRIGTILIFFIYALYFLSSLYWSTTLLVLHLSHFSYNQNGCLLIDFFIDLRIISPHNVFQTISSSILPRLVHNLGAIPVLFLAYFIFILIFSALNPHVRLRYTHPLFPLYVRCPTFRPIRPSRRSYKIYLLILLSSLSLHSRFILFFVSTLKTAVLLHYYTRPYESSW